MQFPGLEQYIYGPLFTPSSEQGTINLTGWGGGANWRGAASDPENGILYVASMTVPVQVKLEKPDRDVFDLQRGVVPANRSYESSINQLGNKSRKCYFLLISIVDQ
jgi:glucose dehydrogenase